MTRSLQLGELTIDVLPEIEHRMMPVSFLFNDLTREQMEANASWLDERFLNTSSMTLGIAFQAYVIRAQGVTILVDSCNGNHKQRPTALWQHDLRSSAFLDNLGRLGLRCEDIDVVVCTHLHCDHVGWNTRLNNGKWIPTFPNARYLFGRTEYEYFLDRYKQANAAPVNHGAFADSVLPVVDAGLAQFVEDDHVLMSGNGNEVSLMPAPGHSFGHCCIRARSGGDEAIICGDALHHPVQLDLPTLKMRADLDPDMAIKTRERLLAHCADTGAWLLAGHIPFYSIAQVRRFEDRFRLV